MKMSLFLSLTFLATLATAQAKPLEDRKSVPAALAAFREGSIEYATHPKEKAESRCKNFKDLFRLYCVEGFYLAGHLEKMATLTDDGAVIKKRLAETPADPSFRLSFLRSLGFAISQMDLDPRKYWNALSDLTENEKLYVLDGWAGGQYPRYGYEVVRRECQQATKEEHRAACFWGMGRGFFFSAIPAGNSPYYDDHFVSGYMFARAMSNPEVMPISEVLKIKTKSTKTAEVYKHTLAKSTKAGKDGSKLSDCLKAKHITQCVDTL